MANHLKKTLVLAFLVFCGVICFGNPPYSPGQGLQGNVALSRWRPTQDYSGARFLGSRVCAQCHTKEAAMQFATVMAQALEVTASCQILSAQPRLTFRNGPYSYQITRQGNRSIYTVSDGVKTISEPILYCFGKGVAGQTYVFRHNEQFYESRVSYFQELQTLDFTILHSHSIPASLEEALGRPMSQEVTQGCFACHATGSVKGSNVELGRLEPGVTCEACHGPGEKHLAAVKAKKYKDLQIFNPRSLDAFEQTQEFCGACHQSFSTVMLLPERGGINNIRFQPYRISKSLGHFINDRRISCVACHDPHGKLEREPSYYDAKCFACHLSNPKESYTATRTAKACRVSQQQCVTCHMPKVELNEMHAKFTDHWIRIVKPEAAVPR